MKKSVIVFFVLALLFVIAAISFLVSGDLAEFAVGLIVAAVFAFLGYRKFAKGKTAAPFVSSVPPAITPQPPIIDTLQVKSNKDAVSPYENITTKVAGVTFKNGRKSRQTILRAFEFRDEPFDKGACDAELRRYEYEGKPAYGVYLNDMQIGNVPADLCEYLNNNHERISGISYVDVYGGGQGKSFGCEIVIRLEKPDGDL